MGETNNPTFFSALSHAPVRSAGNHVNLSIYRDAGETRYGAFKYKAPAEGLVQVGGPHSADTHSGLTSSRSPTPKSGIRDRWCCFSMACHATAPSGKKSSVFSDASAKPLPLIC